MAEVCVNMPGPPPMRDEERSTKAKPPTKAVLEVEVAPARAQGMPAPLPPSALGHQLRQQWAELWESELAGLIAATDVPALERLFVLRARYDELLTLAFAGDDTMPADGEVALPPAPAGLAYGSQGQLVEHPALKAAMAIDKAITALEDRFALTLKARQNAGIRMGKVAKAAAQVAEATREQPPRADPRVTVTGSAAPQPRGSGGDVDGKPARARRGRPRG